MDDHSNLQPAWLPGGAARMAEDGSAVLGGTCCNVCQTRSFPPTTVCSSCMSEDLSSEDMPSTGTLYSFTAVHVGPAQWHRPVTVGYVDLPNGVRVFAHLKPGPDLRIGAEVRLTSGRVGTQADGAPIETFMFQAGE